MSPRDMSTPAWFPVWERRHAWVMLAVTLAVTAAGGLALQMPLALQVAVLAVAVSVFGVPHGALDPLVGRALLAPRVGRWWSPLFHAGYLGLAAAVVGLWLLVPAVAMTLFLLASGLHFGSGDVRRGDAPPAWHAFEVLARGALPIVLPAAAFPGAVAALFGWVMPDAAGAASQQLAGSLRWAGTRLLLPALAAVVVRHVVLAARDHSGGAARHRSFWSAAEVVALAVLCFTAPPLVAFLVYFCGWHSVRHTLHLASQLDPLRPGAALARFLRLGALTTGATLALGTAAWVVLRPAAGATPAAVRVLFVLLSALAFPHMVLVALAGGASPDDA